MSEIDTDTLCQTIEQKRSDEDNGNNEVVVIYVFGNGSKLQLKEPIAATDKLLGIIHGFSRRFCGNTVFIIVYGGDPCNPNSPDIGYVVDRTSERFGNLILFAIQCEEYASYLRSPQQRKIHYPHLNRYSIYDTQRDSKGNILFGGLDENLNPCGTTAVFINAMKRVQQETNITVAVVKIGEGGPISKAEWKLFRELQNSNEIEDLELFEIEAEAANAPEQDNEQPIKKQKTG